MNKKIAVVLVMLSIFMLTSCGKNGESNIIPEEVVEGVQESLEIDESIEIFKTVHEYADYCVASAKRAFEPKQLSKLYELDNIIMTETETSFLYISKSTSDVERNEYITFIIYMNLSEEQISNSLGENVEIVASENAIQCYVSSQQTSTNIMFAYEGTVFSCIFPQKFKNEYIDLIKPTLL